MDWDVTVELNSQAAEYYRNSCTTANGELNSMRLATRAFNAFNWSEFPLQVTQSGNGYLATGTIRLTREATDDGHNWDLDVESNGGICEGGRPFCRRVYISYDGSQINNNDGLSCAAEIESLRAVVSTFISRTNTGTPVTHNFTITPELMEACNPWLLESQWRVTNLDNGNTVASGNIVEGPNQITFSPTQTGTHEFRVSLERMGRCVQVACESVPIAGSESLAARFCVAPEGRTCTVPSVTPGNGEDLSNFSLCRQIPILTAADIQRQVNNARPEEQAQLQTELQRRARDQQGEKRRCCLCTTGNGQFDSATGACAAERDASVRQRQGFKPGIYTAVGCIGADSESIVTSLVRIGLGIAGGIALLMILAGAFLFTTSQGDPKQASQAKELITSAIMGLLFVIFSVTILQFIGVTILQIPGFGSTGP